MKSILEIKNLSISFGKNEVIHNISYNLNENEILGIVGESGSGKSVSSLAILGLLPKNISKITDGSILYNELELTDLPPKAFQKIRGNKIAMIFQEPMSSLNPSMTCGKQVEEILLQHSSLSKKEIKEETISLFEKVKLPNPERVFKAYPHEISGGQKQRVMIAMAIACKPDVLIADEPTTALDVTVQNDIVNLLKELQIETKMSIIFITHDLALISEIADRVIVMYKGNIVEHGSVKNIFKDPQHNYTKALIKSRPSLRYSTKKLQLFTDFLNDNISE
ncbi:UNVERIFIED_CONTAM: hypothetical protein GTU68_050502 [Idotea baltica]|nr:hypothetical protein [Idotea baltica]